MNENNMNQTQNGYPQSGYPQSNSFQGENAYPQSSMPYPQSSMPYSQPGYEAKKRTSVSQIILISAVAVLIVALAITLIVLLQDKNDDETTTSDVVVGVIDAPPGSVLLNDEIVTFNVLEEGGKTYLPAKEFISAVGLNCVINGDKIEISSPVEFVTLEIGSTSVELKDLIMGGTTSVNITTAPFRRNDTVYFYARDISFFLKNATVSYNPHFDVVEIRVEQMAQAPAGAPPAGAPPVGAQPPAGAPPQGVQPPAGAPPVGAQPPAGAPPQGVQPPAGAPPVGAPPQN